MLPVHSLKWSVDMNRDSRVPDMMSHRSTAAGINAGVLLIVALAVLVIVLGAWLIPRHNQPALVTEPVPATQTAAEPQVASPSPVSQDEPPAETKRTTLKPRVSSVPAAEVSPSSPSRPEPSPMTRQLVTSLSQLDVGHGPITPEQAGAWKQTLQQLAEQKGAAIPAIREFLEKNLDINFDA